MERKILIPGITFLLIIISFCIGYHRSYQTKNINFEGQIKDVYVGGINDLVITLRNDSKRYFINRGIEKGISTKMIKKQLGLKNIRFTTKPEGINLFDIDDSLKEIENIIVNDSLYYKIQY